MDQSSEIIEYQDWSEVEVMNAKESAAFLRISYNEFLIKCRKGVIPHFTIGEGKKQRSPIFCRRSTLGKWISDKEMASISPPKIIRRLK